MESGSLMNVEMYFNFQLTKYNQSKLCKLCQNMFSRFPNTKFPFRVIAGLLILLLAQNTRKNMGHHVFKISQALGRVSGFFWWVG